MRAMLMLFPVLVLAACAAPGKTVQFREGDFALLEAQLQG